MRKLNTILIIGLLCCASCQNAATKSDPQQEKTIPQSPAPDKPENNEPKSEVNNPKNANDPKEENKQKEPPGTYGGNKAALPDTADENKTRRAGTSSLTHKNVERYGANKLNLSDSAAEIRKH
jgi:hypothetical protein